jgi:hypothetical protein
MGDLRYFYSGEAEVNNNRTDDRRGLTQIAYHCETSRVSRA